MLLVEQLPMRQLRQMGAAERPIMALSVDIGPQVVAVPHQAIVEVAICIVEAAASLETALTAVTRSMVPVGRRTETSPAPVGLEVVAALPPAIVVVAMPTAGPVVNLDPALMVLMAQIITPAS